MPLTVITPYLLYGDVGGALRFLRRAFGFRVVGPKFKGKNGRLVHASVKAGKAMIMLGCPGRKYRNPKRLGQHTQYLYIMIRGVDAHCKRARRAGARIVEEPVDMFYGHRRYGAEDPEGHQWEFAEEKKAAKRVERPGRLRPA